MIDTNIRDVANFQVHPIITNHLSKEENLRMLTVFQIMEMVRDHAEVVDGKIELDSEDYSNIVTAFETTFNLFMSHFNRIQVEIMQGMLIPLRDIIRKSDFYMFGQVTDLDLAFEAINCREEEIGKVALRVEA